MFSRLLRTIFASAALTITVASGAADLVIGQVAPLKDPTSPGNQMRAGIQLYFDVVNSRGGINGNQLKLVSRDRGFDAADSVLKTRELLNEAEPLALIGLLGTGPMEALVKEKVLANAGIPAVGIRTGAISLHNPVNPYLFHTRANYGVEIDKIVKQLTTLGIRRMAVFYENTAFGKEGLAGAERTFKESKVTMAAKGSYEQNSTEVATAVKTIAAANPQAVILVANSAAASEFYKQWHATGKNAQVIALSVADYVAIVKRISKEEAQGLSIAQVVPDPTKRRLSLVREAQDNLKKFAPQTELNQTVLEGYIAAKVLVEGLKKSSRKPTRKKLTTALESLKEFDAGGVPISFSPTNHSGSSYVEIGIITRDGTLRF